MNTKKITKQNDKGVVNNYVFNHKGTAIAWFITRFPEETDIDGGLFYLNLNGGEPQKVTGMDYNQYSFSNDDSALEYSYYNPDEQKTVYMKYNIKSGQESSYNPEPTSLIVKIASPDDKKFAYTSERDGKKDIYITDIDGKNEKRLTTIGTVDGNPVWDLTGNYLLFDSRKTEETAKYIVGLAGKDPKKISDEYLLPYDTSAGY